MQNIANFIILITESSPKTIHLLQELGMQAVKNGWSILIAQFKRAPQVEKGPALMSHNISQSICRFCFVLPGNACCFHPKFE